MNETHTKSHIKLSTKNSKKFSGILRHLAKSENYITKIKVTISKGEIRDEEKDQFLVAPLTYKSSFENIPINNFIENSNKNFIEDLNNENKNSSSYDNDLKEYPDSSDFSDDE